MRRNRSGRSVSLCSIVLIGAAHGCAPAPVSDGRYWVGRGDAGGDSTVKTDSPPGTGGSILIPEGSGGAGFNPGSGGVTGTGGSFGSGGAIGGSDRTGGSIGSGGERGSGGIPGMGAMGAAAGTGAFGGGPGSAGRMALGGSGGASGAGGPGGAAGGGGAAGASGNPGALTGTLTVTVTTRTVGGRYAPDNVGAIWIADATGKFVKSLNVWAVRRRADLATWRAATAAAGKANNVVDAITAATLPNYGVRTGTWNGTDTNKVLVPDGSYRVCFELRDGSGQTNCVNFMKSREPQTLMPPDTTSFTKRVIGYTP